MNNKLIYILLSGILITLIFIGVGIFKVATALEDVSYSIDLLRVHNDSTE